MVQLRLAIATSRFWPLVEDGSTHLLRLAESLIAAGHQVTVVTPQWKRAWPKEITIGTVSVVRLPSAPRGGWSTLRWMYALRSWLQTDFAQKMDALLVSGLRHEAYVTLGQARLTGPTTLLLAGEGDLAWEQTATFGRRIGARCREASSIIAPSEALADELAAAGYRREAITVIPRRVALPPPRSPKLREEAQEALAAANYDLVATDTTTVALAVGRLDAEHRFGDLVRAWRIVSARKPSARLWIIGDGPDRDSLYRQISDLDQRFRVLIPGTFDGLDELLQAADLLLAPGGYKAPPLAMLQAMAAGLPVVAANTDGLREHLGSGGLFTPIGDFKAIAAQVLKLLDDPALAISLGAAAREQAQASPTQLDEARQYADLIQRVRS